MLTLNLLFLGSCLENLGKLKQNLAINANIKHIFAILGVDLNIWRLSAVFIEFFGVSGKITSEKYTLLFLYVL